VFHRPCSTLSLLAIESFRRQSCDQCAR
jgi:hypothetical protein